MATVTILPVTTQEDARGWAGEAVQSDALRRAGVLRQAEPSVRPVRPAEASPGAGSGERAVREVAAVPARKPRPVICYRSYEPDLHGSRLTGRGKLVVAVLWVLIATAIAVMVSRPAGVPVPAETATVVVEPGDTLWGVAEVAVPEGDRRVTISQIVELNGLRSAGDIRPGDVLIVPAER